MLLTIAYSVVIILPTFIKRLLNYLGYASFAIYLFHMPILGGIFSSPFFSKNIAGVILEVILAISLICLVLQVGTIIEKKINISYMWLIGYRKKDSKRRT